METLSDLDNFTASLDIQRLHLSALRLNPNNTQKDHRVNELAESLEIHGQFKPIVVWQGMVMCGNGTFQAARKLGWRYIQCNVLPEDMPAEQAQAIALIDNRTFSDPDEEQIALILQSLPDDLPTGYSDEEYKELLARLGGDEGEGESKDAEPQTSKADELREVWQTEAGQLWRMPARDGKGEHRLIVGDCTDRAVVDRLMGGEVANIVSIDPPYSSGGFQESGKASGSIGARGGKTISNDNLSTRGYKLLIGDSLSLIPASHLFLFCDWKMWIETFDIAERAGYKVRNMIVWDKQQMGMGMPFRNQHELILFGSKVSAKIGNGATPNVLQHNRDNKAEHNTPKPVELIEKFIKQVDGDIVVDMFAGGGTTLIAAENLNRYCRAVEISPAYCAVILQRYKDAFGITPVLIDD